MGAAFSGAGAKHLQAIQDYLPKFKAPKLKRHYPTMVTSSYEEIAAHNARCSTRQVRRRKARNSSYSR